MILKRGLVVLLYFLLSEGQAQEFAGENIEWSEGKIVMTKGVTLTGVLRYNSKSGLLSFNDGDESKALTPRSVVSFEYFDAIKQTQRKFYSIDVEDSKGIRRPQFFEIIKECITFAVISTQNPVELKKKQAWDPIYANTFGEDFNQKYRSKTVASQIEILYLIDNEGDINPYLIITNEESPRSFTNDTKSKTKTKIVGDDYLKKLTDPHYSDLKAYAKEFKLDFGKKEELIRILDHYDQLVENN